MPNDSFFTFKASVTPSVKMITQSPLSMPIVFDSYSVPSIIPSGKPDCLCEIPSSIVCVALR